MNKSSVSVSLSLSLSCKKLQLTVSKAVTRLKQGTQPGVKLNNDPKFIWLLSLASLPSRRRLVASSVGLVVTTGAWIGSLSYCFIETSFVVVVVFVFVLCWLGGVFRWSTELWPGQRDLYGVFLQRRHARGRPRFLVSPKDLCIAKHTVSGPATSTSFECMSWVSIYLLSIYLSSQMT